MRGLPFGSLSLPLLSACLLVGASRRLPNGVVPQQAAVALERTRWRERLARIVGGLLGSVLLEEALNGERKAPDPGLYVVILVVGLILAGYVDARSRKALRQSPDNRPNGLATPEGLDHA
jgi:hypothetical protein